MRIIAGQYRGRALAAVGKGDAGAHLRPTTDRVRESLFNVLANHDPFEGARVLDLFAGTGALGLEAMSRGAAHVTFVDDGAVAGRLIRENMRLLGVSAGKLMRCAAQRLPQNREAPCSLVFLDPPYGSDLGAKALSAAIAGGWVAPGALVVWEDSKPQTAPGLTVIDTRKYGDTSVTLLTPND